MSWRSENRYSAEKLDVLEKLPRRTCSVRGCGRRSNALEPWVSAFGSVHHLCFRHRPLYAEHDAILRRIRNL